MIILNLFIGVVMEGFGRAREQVAEEREALAAVVVEDRNELEAERELIHERLTALTRDMHRLMTAAQRARANGGSSATSSTAPDEPVVSGY